MSAPRIDCYLMNEQFFALTPESVLDAVEDALTKLKPGIRATGRAIALNSLENRVYDIELEDETNVVAKFYRPQRWTKEQILEEHQFLLALENAEIPVIAPLLLSNQSTLSETGDQITFALFPKVKGRIVDELAETQLQTLGRYVSRIHSVGKGFKAKHRIALNVENYATKSLDFLLENQWIDLTYENNYKKVVQAISAKAAPLLQKTEKFLVHGDCHLGNTLWQGESPFFLDFDDSVIAPPVQDIWMIITGRDEENIRNRDILLEAYEVHMDFDYESLKMIEALRALRMIHYSAWIARRWKDPSFPKAFPDFISSRYWAEEITALEECVRLL